MKIRTATPDDLHAITKVEAICFPPTEAASQKSFESRLNYYPNHFWLLENETNLVGFVNGMVSDEEHLRDEMYENADMHNESGKWQMIFGVNTIPAYRRKGCAEKLILQVISDAKKQDRKGLVLTCKDALIPYYKKFGFQDEGLSASTHGEAVWHEMRLIL